MQDVPLATLVGQIFVFYLVAFPVIGLATHAIAWIVYCWRQPGEGYLAVARRGLKGGFATEESWRDALLHGNLDDVLERVQAGGCPERRRAHEAVEAKVKKAEQDREVLLLLDTSCTPGTAGLYAKFKVGGWYRRRFDGLLMRLEEVEVRNSTLGRFRSKTRLQTELLWLPASELEPAQPQVDEWWRFVACKRHENVPQDVKVADNAFWKQALRQEQLECGCLVPSNFGMGIPALEEEAS